MNVGDKWCPSGVHTGASAIKKSSSVAQSMEWSTSSASLQVCGTADTPGGWDDIQGDLDKLEEWPIGILWGSIRPSDLGSGYMGWR